MKIENIDDLLGGVVSPSLIAGYEKQNCVKLTEINEEYKKVSHKNPPLMIIRWLNIEALILVIAFIIYLANSWFGGPVFGLTVMIVIGVLVYLHYNFIVRKKVFKVSEIFSRCGPKLEDFRRSVYGLSPTGCSFECTDDSVQKELVSCAVRILEAETKFDVIRIQKERRTSEILQSAKWLEKCHTKFDHAFDCARKFDLWFNNSDIFAEAQKQIERTNQLLGKSATEKAL